MKIVYITGTGQTRKFVNKLEMDSLEVTPTNPFLSVYEPFIMIIPSYEKDITEIAWDFMDTANNIQYCKGVIGNGNRNFAKLFCFSAKDLAVDYNLPYLHEFEFQGSINDVDNVNRIVKQLEEKTHQYFTPIQQGYYGESKSDYTNEEITVVSIELIKEET